MMKAHHHNRGSGGFTLPEMMISMALFIVLRGGVVVVNLYGLRWFKLTQVKLLASDSARKAVGHMCDEIRTASSLYVGSVTNGVFTACASGSLQQGGSLLIYESTNSTNYILYYFNSPDLTFRRMNTVIGTNSILASTVTNSATIFQLQNYQGTVISNSQNNCLVHCSLQFYSAGTTNPVADFYKLEISAAPRVYQ